MILASKYFWVIVSHTIHKYNTFIRCTINTVTRSNYHIYTVIYLHRAHFYKQRDWYASVLSSILHAWWFIYEAEMLNYFILCFLFRNGYHPACIYQSVFYHEMILINCTKLLLTIRICNETEFTIRDWKFTYGQLEAWNITGKASCCWRD